MTPNFGGRWLPGRGDRTIEPDPGVPGFTEIWGDRCCSATSHVRTRCHGSAWRWLPPVSSSRQEAGSRSRRRRKQRSRPAVRRRRRVAPSRCTLGYTGAAQTFSVPAGVTSVTVTAWGGRGGKPDGATAGAGGRGAYVTGTFGVSGGATLTVVVGGDGSSPAAGFGSGAGGDAAPGTAQGAERWRRWRRVVRVERRAAAPGGRRRRRRCRRWWWRGRVWLRWRWRGRRPTRSRGARLRVRPRGPPRRCRGYGRRVRHRERRRR